MDEIKTSSIYKATYPGCDDEMLLFTDSNGVMYWFCEYDDEGTPAKHNKASAYRYIYVGPANDLFYRLERAILDTLK